MRISDWSSDVCSSDLGRVEAEVDRAGGDFDQADEQASRIELKLNAGITERDGRINERDGRIEERDHRLLERDNRLMAQAQHIRALDQAIDHFRGELAKAQERHDAEATELRMLLADKQAEVATLMSSTSWRVAMPVRLLGRPIQIGSAACRGRVCQYG